MAQFTDYGKAVKHRLIDENRTQAWLIDRVREKTGLYCDSAYMAKILNGQEAGTKIVSAINEILGLEG